MPQATRRWISEKVKSLHEADLLPYHEILDVEMGVPGTPYLIPRWRNSGWRNGRWGSRAEGCGALARVLVTKERLLPAVSPLSDVMRQTRTYDTRQSTHFKRRRSRPELAKNCV